MSFLVASGHVEVTAQTRDAHRDIDALVERMRRISPAANDASTAMNRLRDSTRETGRSVTSLNTRMRTTSDRMQNLRDNSRELDELMRRLQGSTSGLGGALGRSSGDVNRAAGGMNRLIRAAVMLSPALIPIAASAVSATASLGAAGVAVGAFGAAIIPQIKVMTEAADAEKKYEKAVREYGASSAQAAKAETEYLRLVREMPPATRQAAAALSVLKTEYKEWSTSLAGDTMPVAMKSFAVFGALFPRLTPMVRGASGELNRFLTIIGGGVASPGFERFMNEFAEFSTGALAKANDGLIRFMRTMNGSGAGMSSDVGEFMDYVRANGPLVADTLGNLGRALMHLVVAASDVGVTMLTVINGLAKIVNAVPTGVITTLMQLALAFKAIKLAGAGMAAVGAGVAAVGARLTAAGTAAAGAAGGLARARAGFMALGASTRANLIAAGIAAVVVSLAKISAMGRGPAVDVDRLTTSLGSLGRTGRVSGEAAKAFGKDLGGLADSLRVIARPDLNQGVKAAIGNFIGFDAPEIGDAKKDLDGVDKALANLVKGGHADLAAAAFQRMAAYMRKQGLTSGELKKQFGDYKAALADAKFEQELAARSMGLFGQQAVSVGAKLDAQKQSADGLRQAIQALNDVQRAGLGGMIGFEAAIDAAAKAAKENAGALSMTHGELNLNSEKARTAATALQDLAAKTDEATGAARESGASWQRISSIYSRGRASFVQAAQAMGLTKAEANQLADQLLKIPDGKNVKVNMQTEDAVTGLNSVISKIKATPDSKSVTVKALSAGAITTLQDLGLKVKQLPDGSFKVTAKTGSVGEALGKVKAQRDGLKDKSITLSAKAQAAITGLAAVEAKIKATPGSKTVTVKSLTGSAITALEAVGFKVKRLPNGKITVTAATGSAQANIGAVQRARDRLSSKSITITTRRVNITESIYYTIRGTKNLAAAHGRAGGGPAPRVPGYADGGRHIAREYPEGGYVDGPGTSTSDSILVMGSRSPYRVSNTEYIMQGTAVAKYGVRMMDAINAGRFPGFKKGGLTEKQKAKIEAEKQRQKEGKSALTSDVTFTTAGKLAGYKYTETVHDLGMPDSVSSLVTSINTYLSNIKKAFTGKTEKALVSKLTASGKALLDNQKKLEANSKALESAKSNLEDLKGKFDSLKTSVSSSLVSFGNITKIGKYGTSPQTLINQLQSDTARTSKFADQLTLLSRMGLNATALSDIAQAGVTGGGMATAESLLKASPEQIKQINDLQAQLQKSADAAGATTASAMYGAGIRAAEGLVAGLTAKQKAIEDQMMKIAKSMEAAIKKALGIKSPSRVMEQVGNFAFQGVERGWVKRQAQGKTLIGGSAGAYRPPVTRTLPASTAPAAGPAGGNVTIQNLNINGTFDFASPAERRAAAKALVKDMKEELRIYDNGRR